MPARQPAIILSTTLVTVVILPHLSCHRMKRRSWRKGAASGRVGFNVKTCNEETWDQWHVCFAPSALPDFFRWCPDGKWARIFPQTQRVTPVCFGAKARMVVMAASPQTSIPNHELTFGWLAFGWLSDREHQDCDVPLKFHLQIKLASIKVWLAVIEPCFRKIKYTTSIY